MVIKKNKLYEIIFCIIIIIPFFSMPILEIKIKSFDIIQKIYTLFVYSAIIFIFIKKNKLNNYKFFIAYILFFVILLLNTIINNGEVNECIKESIKCIMMFFAYSLLFQKYKISFLKANAYFFEFLITINLLFMILYPNGLYSTNTSTLNWILGYKNSFILYVLPAIFFNLLINYVNEEKISLKTKIVILISIITILLSNSSTAIIGITILLVGTFIVNTIKKNNSYSLNHIIIIYIILFFIIVMLRLQNIFSFFIEDLLNKNLTFTNRTYIWDTAIKYILKNPLLGYGYQTIAERIINFSYIQAISCHNWLLDIIYQNGLIGMVSIIYMISNVKKQIQNIVNKNIKNLSLVLLLSYAIMMLTEYYRFYNFIFLIVIILNISSINCDKKEIN